MNNNVHKNVNELITNDNKNQIIKNITKGFKISETIKNNDDEDFDKENSCQIIKVRSAYKITIKEASYCYKESKYNEEIINYIFNILKKIGEVEIKKENKDEKESYLGKIQYVESKNKKDNSEINYYIDDKKKIITLSKWVTSKQVDFKNNDEVNKVIEVIRNFHEYAKGIVNIPVERNYYGKWISIMERKIKEIYLFGEIVQSKKEQNVTEFDILFLKNMKVMIKDSIQSIEKLYNTHYYEKSKKAMIEGQICHHDLEYHNILLDDNGKYYLIDFEYAIGDIVHHDVMSFLNRVASKNNYNERNVQYVNKMFKLYNFNIDDKRIITSFLQFSEEFWQVGYQYYIERQDWSNSRFMRKLEKAIESRNDKKKLIEQIEA